MGEAEEVSLDFDSFLHTNGTLYSCFNHHGNRVYVDETQVRMWPPGGRFLYWSGVCVTHLLLMSVPRSFSRSLRSGTSRAASSPPTLRSVPYHACRL